MTRLVVKPFLKTSPTPTHPPIFVTKPPHPLETTLPNATPKKRPLLRTLWVFLAVMALLLGSLLLAPVQTFWLRKLAATYSARQGGKIELGSIRVGVGGSLRITQLLLLEPGGDTLLWVNQLETRLHWWKLPEALVIDRIKLKGGKVQLQVDSAGRFNFAHLLPPSNVDSLLANDTVASSSMRYQIGPVQLQNIHFGLQDALAGTHLRLLLDSLYLRADSLQPAINRYHLAQLAVKGLHVDYADAGKAPAAATDTSSTPLELRLDQLQISQSSLALSNPSSETKVWLGQLQLQLPWFDLAGEKMQLDSFLLADSKVVYSEKRTFTPTQELTESQEPTAFLWPTWQVQAKGIDLLRNSVEVALPDSSFGYSLGQFQVAALYRPGYLNGQLLIRELNTHNGLQLAQGSAQLQLTDTEMLLSGFELRSRASALSGMLEARYPQLAALFDLSEAVHLKSRGQLDLLPAEFASLLGELARDPQTAAFLPLPLAIQWQLAGNTRELKLDSLAMQWAAGTTLTASGSLQQPLTPEQMRLRLPNLLLRSVQSDLNLLYIDTLLAVPAYAQLSGSAELSLLSFKGDLNLLLPEGRAHMLGQLKQADSLRYTAELQLEGAAWAKLFKQADWGDMVLHLQAEGVGIEPQSLAAVLEGRFNKLRYRSEKLDGLGFSGSMQAGHFDFSARLDQEVLGFDLAAKGNIDSLRNTLDLRLQLFRAQLHRLGLREEELLARLELEAHYEAQGQDLQARIQLHNALLQEAGGKHQLKEQSVYFTSNKQQSSLQLAGELASGQMQANAAWDSLYGQLASLFSQWAIDSASTLKLTGEVKLHPATELLGILAESGTQLDTLSWQLMLDGGQQQLDMQASLPALAYADTRLQGMLLTARLDGRQLEAVASFSRLEQGEWVQIDSTWLQLTRATDTLLVALGVNRENGEAFYRLAADYLPMEHGFWVHLQPQELLLQGSAWQVPPNNFVRVANPKILSEEFELKRADESFGLKADGSDDLALYFDGFRLSNLTALLDADSVPLRGALKGRLQLENLFTQPAFVADLQVDRLRLPDLPLGSLRLNATNPAGDRYAFTAQLGGAGTAFELDGFYLATAQNPRLEVQLQIDTLPMPLFAQLSGGQLREASGYLSADLRLSGSPSAPQYDGKLAFNQAAFRLQTTNTKLSLPNERIRINNSGIYFDQLQLRDSLNNILAVSGQIKTPSLLQPQLDMKVEAANFQLLNAARGDNPYLYGNAAINTKARISGTPAKPVIDLEARLNKGSKLWLVVPESEAALIAREGVVVFIEPEATAFDSLLAPAGNSSLLGLTLRAALQVDPQTELTVVVDERAGDQLVLSGKADLRYELYPNGRQTLTGRYEVGKGAYELSLYQLVKRRFELVPGSTITWRGNPTDAALDLRAMYRVKTAPLDLLSEQLSGTDASQLNRYRQELPFEVYTRITGELLRPAVAFSLDMPEAQRGAIDGQVYARVQRLNQQDDELNRQVFSLLVLNRFVPAVQSQSGTGLNATSLARSSASQLLSSQLNSLSARYLKGVDLNVNLNSFTDYQSGQAADRTVAQVQLQKNLFNERLLVQLGSQVDLEGNRAREQKATDLLGDLSLEYLLNADGSLRLRAFRRQQFEGVVEGQLVVSGTSLVYSREFTRFSEAFRSRPTPSLQPEAPKKEEKP